MGIWAHCSAPMAWAEEVRPSLSALFDGLRQHLGCLSALSPASGATSSNPLI